MADVLIQVSWIGFREPDPVVVGALKEIDPRADLRWVPGPADRPPVWEVGAWHDWDKDLRAQAVHALDMQYDRQVERRSQGQILFNHHVLMGWRPVFVIAGRDPDGRDVKEFQFRNWIVENAWKQEMDKFFGREDTEGEETEDEMRERWTQKAEDMVSDDVLMGVLQAGRKSTHGAGLSVL